MARNKHNKLQAKWIILLGISLVLLIGLGLLKNSGSQSQQQEAEYLLYQNSEFSFNIEYPKTWEIRKDTQVFENGDAVAFGISGPTQKENTELTDGVQVAVSKPFSINKDLATWVREYYDSKSEFSQNSLGKYTYQTVYTCNLGCMTYFYTTIDGQVYGVAMFAQGPDKEKAAYENAGLHMVRFLKFDNAESEMTSENQAIVKVKALPEVIDYLKRVPNGLVAVNGEENNTYMVQVYEVKNGHTATFNWYKVDKTTGVTEKQF